LPDSARIPYGKPRVAIRARPDGGAVFVDETGRETRRRCPVKISDVMTEEVVTVRPERSLKEVAEILALHRISGAPVVDANGTVIGVVSELDIVRQEVGEEKPSGRLSRLFGRRRKREVEKRTARDAMTSPPITIGPRREVSQAARTMVELGINRLPVVDDGRLVGIVARADLVGAFLRSDEEIAHELRDDVVTGTLWIDPKAVSIDVKDGVVTLGGEVDTRADAELLSLFALRVPGVVEVRSRLTWRIEEPRLQRSDPHVPRPVRGH
jgi:CBS domain-containing protein